MTDVGTAPGKQLRLSLAPPEGEAGIGERRRDAPVCLPRLHRKMDSISRTAVYVIRTHGGVGGGAP